MALNSFNGQYGTEYNVLMAGSLISMVPIIIVYAIAQTQMKEGITLGVVRIKKNLSLDTDDVVGWCREKINSDNFVITRNGKNWYVHIDACIITVNAYSYTIITAHKEK